MCVSGVEFNKNSGPAYDRAEERAIIEGGTIV
jgi:hypothetical protein